MSQKQSLRQTRLATVLPMVGNSANELGDSVLSKIDAQLAKMFEDRNILLTDGGVVTFTGTAVQFTEAINIVLNQKISGAAPQIISLAATTRTVSANGRMIYAVINRTAGTATVTDDATTLPAAASANQEVFLIAKRIDATDGTQRLYFRNGAAFNAGQSARLGSAGSGSGSGSGTGDDLNALTFKASFTDLFDDIPTATNSGVDTGAGKTDSTLYSAVNAMFQLNYDASKTVTGTSVNMTLSGTPAFTVKIGDMLIVNLEARRIVTVTSQTVYVIESAFTTNPTALQATVSQAVYSKDINAFAGDGIAPSTAFSTTINQIMAVYEDTTTAGDKIFDANTAPVIGYTASSDGTTYTPVTVRPTNLNDVIEMTSLPTAGTNLYMRIFSVKTSGSGTVNVLGYKVFFHRELFAEDGSLLNQASGLTNGTGTQVNISAITVVAAKTRIKKTWSYPVGVNPNTANGALKVYLNGQKIPRFISASATPDASYKEIDQSTIELDQDYSSYAVLFEIIQDVAVIDTSDTNTTGISQMQEVIQEGFQGMVKSSQLINPTTSTGSPVAGTFYSSIVNRAPITDITQDLKPRMGYERTSFQGLFPMQTEMGSNGEQVQMIPNDFLNLVRFIGAGWAFSVGTQGAQISTVGVGDALEITFYGTGLNLLTNSGFAYNLTAQVDGGSAGGNIYTTASAGILNARQYSPMVIVPVVNGLTLGLHTVKITVNTSVGCNLYGFDTLVDATTLKVQPGVAYVGGKKLVSSAQVSPAYNSGFESGTLGTKGGRVIVYQKADGSIAKAINPTNTSTLTNTSADHANEEMVRQFTHREFSAQRVDDVDGSVYTNANVAFTLDDNTTTYVGSQVTYAGTGLAPSIGVNGGFITLTFVGTGIDFLRQDSANSAGSDTFSVAIDGTVLYSISGTGSVVRRVQKVASGLPYGTHTLTITRTSAASAFNVTAPAFFVYQPKKPTLPSGAVELSDYNILADASTPNTVAGISTISQGTVRRHAVREFMYNQGTGGTSDWVTGLVPVSQIGGFQFASDRLNAYYEYTFFGTGFDLRYQSAANRSSNIPITLNGIALTTGNFAGITTVGLTGSSFNTATGLLTATASTTSGSGFSIRGLPLARYTLKLNNPSTGLIMAETIDVVQPTHSYKSNTNYDSMNTMTVAAAISDNRKLTVVKDLGANRKNIAVANGNVLNPTSTSTSSVTIPDMRTPHFNQSGRIEVSFNGNFSITTQTIGFLIFIDGLSVSSEYDLTNVSNMPIAFSQVFNVAPGWHQVEIRWGLSGGTATAINTYRTLTVKEL